MCFKSSRSEKWKKCFHFYPRSEKFWLSFFFEKCKVKRFCFFEKWKWNKNDSRSRSRSEISKKISRILEKRESRWGLDQRTKKSANSSVRRHFFNMCNAQHIYMISLTNDFQSVPKPFSSKSVLSVEIWGWWRPSG